MGEAQNYYALACQKKVDDFKNFILPVPVNGLAHHATQSPRIVLEAMAARIVEAYGYRFKTERDVELPAESAGYHSHFPKVVVARIRDISFEKAVTTVCHETAHCVQSRTVNLAYRYTHHGEVALDFVDYYLYELKACALAYEIYLRFFVGPGFGSWPQLRAENFGTYSHPSGVIRLYRKWQVKFQRWLQVLDK